MSLRAHAGWSAGAAIVLSGSNFALNAVLARRLDAGAFGQFAYAQWLVVFCFLLLTFGATGAVSRYAAELHYDQARLASFMRTWRPFALGLPVGAGFAVVLGAVLSRLDLPEPTLLALGAWEVASALWAMQTAALTGLQRFDKIFAATVLAAVVMLLGAGLLPFPRHDPTFVFYLMAAACGSASFVGYRTVYLQFRGNTRSIPYRERVRMIRYAFNTWFTAILWNLAWSRGEVPIVRGYLGDERLAHYAVALTLLGGATAGVTLGIAGLAPQVTRYLGEGSDELALRLCRTACDLQLLACGAAGLILIWLGPELLWAAFGSAYASSATALTILGLSLPMLALSLNNHFLQITTDSRFNRNATLAGLVALYLLAFGFVQWWGIDGAAMARTATLWLMGLITIVVTLARRSGSGIGLGNMALAVVLLMVSAGLVLELEWLSLAVRFIGLLSGIAILGVGLRSAKGDRVALLAIKALRA